MKRQPQSNHSERRLGEGRYFSKPEVEVEGRPNYSAHSVDICNFPPKCAPSGVIYNPMEKELQSQETLGH